MLIKTEIGRSGGESADFAGRRLSERGIALVLVLWLTLVLSVVAVSVVRVAQGQVRIAFNLQEAAKAEALADGGFYLAIAALAKPGGDDPWPLDGTVRDFVVAGEMVSVSVRDEGHKIDLNTANYEMLEAAALSMGMNEDEASGIADALIAERLARNRPDRTATLRRISRPSRQFASIRELQPAANLNRADYRRLRDFITVYVSQRAPGTTGIPVARARPFAPANSSNNPGRRARSNTFAISSRVGLGSGAGFERYAVIRLRAGGVAPYQVLHWD